MTPLFYYIIRWSRWLNVPNIKDKISIPCKYIIHILILDHWYKVKIYNYNCMLFDTIPDGGLNYAGDGVVVHGPVTVHRGEHPG